MCCYSSVKIMFTVNINVLLEWNSQSYFQQIIGTSPKLRPNLKIKIEIDCFFAGLAKQLC